MTTETVLKDLNGTIEEYPSLIGFITNIYLGFICLLVIFGVVGNIFSIKLLLHNKHTSFHVYRKHSVTEYLLGLAIGDIWVLVVIGASTLHAIVDVQLPAVPGYCQWEMYGTYIGSFFTSWLIVAFTIERALVVRDPFLARRLTRRHARIVLAGIVCATLLINAWAPFMVERVYQQEQPSEANGTNKGRAVCLPVESIDNSPFLPFITVVDLILGCLIPICVLLVLNCIISVSLRRATRQRRGMSSRSTPIHSRRLTQGDSSEEQQLRGLRPRLSTHSNHEETNTGNSTTTDSNDDNGITALLLTVSVAYVLLNLPSYTIRVIGVLFTLPVSQHQQLFVLERICYMLFYSQFAVNFLLYSIRLRPRRWCCCCVTRRRETMDATVTMSLLQVPADNNGVADN